MTERTWLTSTNNNVEKQMTKSRNCRRSSMRPSIKEGRNETESVSRIAFKGAGGERAEAERPTYFHIFRGEVQLATETVARADYEPKGRGDRFPDKKHVEAGESVLTLTRVGLDTHSPLFDLDFDPIQHHADTIHRTEFVARKSSVSSLLSDEFYLGVNYTPRFGAAFNANVVRNFIGIFGTTRASSGRLSNVLVILAPWMLRFGEHQFPFLLQTQAMAALGHAHGDPNVQQA
ncbi:hypothetical protein niasHS_008022 [Heterodera schachtii]|uniref:Uncharacterized protein n=1 Tax=Heterodera schachtii TaxID=97005 RepID=A0ABD2J2V0_HETSC